MSGRSILSIQSWVAYGHVGNSAAVFPLQRLGHEVWAVSTVVFSNHLGYGHARGPVLPAGDVAEIVRGIADLGVLPRCDAVLSGYLGAVATGEAVLDAVRMVKRANPQAVYCCDPVMGDVGQGMYVRPGIPELLADRLVPLADIVTPNQFELEVLSGRTVASLADACAAARSVLARGPRLVLVTSLRRLDGDDGTIEMLAVTAEGAWLVATPSLPIMVNGSGDATAALFLAYWLESGEAADALGRTAAAIFAVMAATAASGERELQLVAAQDAMVAPERRFPVRPVAV